MNAPYDVRNRYLVQFRQDFNGYFTTDCAYREDDLDGAYRYLQLIVENSISVVAGRIFDQKFKTWTIHLRKADIQERTQS